MPRRTVSADSHIIEPPDLWTKRIEAAYRDRAPRIVHEPAGDYFVCEDRKPDAIGTFVSPFFRKEPFAKRFEEGQRGGWDPDARVKDMDLDGIAAEVLYPNLAMRLYGLRDPGLQRACFRAYNEWLAEFCAAHPKRLYGIALVSLFDLAEAVAGLRRAAKLGLAGAAVWCDPPGDAGFADDRQDPFWAAAQELGVPISLHTFTGQNREMNDVFLARYTCITARVQESLGSIIFSRVLERFPRLQLVSAENDIGWVAYFLQRMDYGYQRKGVRRFGRFASGLLPGEQFRRNVKCTFMDDRVGIASLGLIGPEVLMWSSDYPHDDSTWPRSQQLLDSMLRGVPREAQDKIVFSNAARLYRMGM